MQHSRRHREMSQPVAGRVKMCRGGVLDVKKTRTRDRLPDSLDAEWPGGRGIQFTGGVGVALVYVGCDVS